MIGHPDGCVCHACRHNAPFTGYPSEWARGDEWPRTPFVWLSPTHAADASLPASALPYAGASAEV